MAISQNGVRRFVKMAAAHAGQTWKTYLLMIAKSA